MAMERVFGKYKSAESFKPCLSSPLIGPISLGKYLDTGLIKCVNVGGEMAPKAGVRPTEYEWVKSLYLEAKGRNIEFYFHQSGSMFLKDGKNIGKWNLNEQIRCAQKIQHELERTLWYKLLGYPIAGVSLENADRKRKQILFLFCTTNLIIM